MSLVPLAPVLPGANLSSRMTFFSKQQVNIMNFLGDLLLIDEVERGIFYVDDRIMEQHARSIADVNILTDVQNVFDSDELVRDIDRSH